jgi:hypothetical protein
VCTLHHAAARCCAVVGDRRSGHGADVNDEPDLCKVMAWGVNVSIKPCPMMVATGVSARSSPWRVWRVCVRKCVLLAS